MEIKNKELQRITITAIIYNSSGEAQLDEDSIDYKWVTGLKKPKITI